MNNAFVQFLGLCRKAGKLVAGTEKVKSSIKKEKAFLIILGSDISLKTEKEIKFLSKNIEVLRTKFKTEELSHAVGVKAGVFAVIDKNFAEQIKLKGGTL